MGKGAKMMLKHAKIRLSG